MSVTATLLLWKMLKTFLTKQERTMKCRIANLSLYNHAKNSLDFQYSAGPSGPSAQMYSGLYFVTMSYNCGNATCCIIKDKKYPQLIMCKWEFGMSEGGVLSPFGINP